MIETKDNWLLFSSPLNEVLLKYRSARDLFDLDISLDGRPPSASDLSRCEDVIRGCKWRNLSGGLGLIVFVALGSLLMAYMVTVMNADYPEPFSLDGPYPSALFLAGLGLFAIFVGGIGVFGFFMLPSKCRAYTNADSWQPLRYIDGSREEDTVLAEALAVVLFSGDREHPYASGLRQQARPITMIEACALIEEYRERLRKESPALHALRRLGTG